MANNAAPGTQEYYQGVADGSIVPSKFEDLFSENDRSLASREFAAYSPSYQAWARANPQAFAQDLLAHRNTANQDLGSIGAEGGYSAPQNVKIGANGLPDYSGAGYQDIHDGNFLTDTLLPIAALAAGGYGLYSSGLFGLGSAAGGGEIFGPAMESGAMGTTGAGAAAAAAAGEIPAGQVLVNGVPEAVGGAGGAGLAAGSGANAASLLSSLPAVTASQAVNILKSGADAATTSTLLSKLGISSKDVGLLLSAAGLINSATNKATPPTVPNTATTAQQQLAAELTAANANKTLTSNNQVTPYGTINYTPGTPDANGVSQWTQTTTLSPAQQKLLESQQSLSQTKLDTGNTQATNLAALLKNPVNYSSLPQLNYGGQTQQTYQPNGASTQSIQQGTPNPNAPTISQPNFGTKQNFSSIDSNPQAADLLAQFKQFSGDTTSSSLSQYLAAHPEAASDTRVLNLQSGKDVNSSDPATINGEMTQVGSPYITGSTNTSTQGSSTQYGTNPIQGSVYTGNLNPLATRVTPTGNTGMVSSAGYGSIQDNLSVKPEDLAAQFTKQQKAAYDLQTQYLDPKYQQQQHDRENQLIQQGVMQNSDAWNRAVNNDNLQRQSDYTNALNNSVGLGNTAQDLLFNQDLKTGQFHNSAQAQGFGQSLSNAELANNVNNQQFNQGLQNAVLGNSANNQQYNQNLSNANYNNTAQNQGFNQSLAARQQGISEINGARNQGLNELNSLQSGSTVTNPTSNASSTANVKPVDYTSLINNAYAQNMGQYNAAQTQNNNLTSGLFNLGASLLGTTTKTGP